MKKKRTLQNNLSYALKYMFGNYGINIFLDSKKFIVTLDNLIPNLQEETNLVKFAIQKNAISAIINAYDQREVDKNFAYLRAKTILTKNGVSEKATLYLLDCFLYAFDWIDDVPDYEDLSDEDFVIAKMPEKSTDSFSKKLEIQSDSNKVKKMPTVKLNKKDTSDDKDNTPKQNITLEKVEPLHFEEKSLSSKKEIEEDNISKEENNMKNDKHETKTNSKYYLNHDFGDNDENYNYEYDDDDEYYDDESGSLFKKIALILITVVIIGGLGFFAFKNLNKDADVTFNGVSITTEYQMDNDTYVLPISKQTNLEVVMDSNNSKPIDTNKLRFKLENGSICNFQSSGKKCNITGLAKGNTKLIVIYNNEIIGTVPLYFKSFTEEEKQNQEDNTEEENTTTKQETSSSDNNSNSNNKKNTNNSNNTNKNNDANKDSNKNNNNNNGNKDNNNKDNKDNNKDNNKDDNNKPKPKPEKPDPKPVEPKPDPGTEKPEPTPEEPTKPGDHDTDTGDDSNGSNNSGESSTTTESSETE